MNDEFDDLFEEPGVELSSDELELRELEDRLGKFKGPSRESQKIYAKGVGLVMSFGFVLAGCLIGGLFLGDYMVQRTGHEIFKVAGILFGLLVAGFAGVKLMGPFLKSDD